MSGAGRDVLDAGWIEGPVGLAYLSGVVRRQVLVLILVPLTFVLLGLAFLVLAEPRYTATATIRVQLDQPATAGAPSPLDTHVELIQSNRITSAVIEAMHLEQILDPTPGRLRQAIRAVRERLGLEGDEEWSDLDEQSLLIQQVQGGLGVQRIGDAAIIAISYTSSQRSLSVDVANAFASAYVSEVAQSEERSVQRRTGRLTERAEEVRRLASSAEAMVQRLLSETSFTVASAEDLEGRIAELRRQLSDAGASEAEVEARLSAITPGEDEHALEAAALQSSETQAVYSDMMSASNALEALRRQPGVSADTIERIEQDIAAMRASLEQSARRVRHELELELAVVSARRSSLLGELEKVLDYSRSPEWSELIEAQQRAVIYQTLHQQYLNDLENLNRDNASGGVSLVSEARPPIDPSFPDYKVLLVLTVALGILAGAGLAGYREWARTQARTTSSRASSAGSYAP